MKDFSDGDLHGATERLAYIYWERRGRPIGSPEIDWSQAEKDLAAIRERSGKEFSLSSLRLGPDEGPYRPG